MAERFRLLWCRRLPLVGGLLLLLLGACSRLPPEPVAVEGVAYYSMPWSVKVAALPSGMSRNELQQQLQAVLDDTNRVLSTYQPDTELMRFNRAPVGSWVPVSPTLFRAVATAQQVSKLSDGAYDVTVAPLVNLWGFGPEARPEKVPDERAIQAARARVGWQHVALDSKTPALKRVRDVSLDLSSLGEGLGADRMAEWLEQHGVHDYMSAVAGSIRVSGKRPGGKPWVLAIETPDASGQPQRVLAMQDRAMSTSGSYRNYFERDGQRYSHTIDPATGRPITHRGVSVTVVAAAGEDDTYADALATAFNVLGPDAGLELAEKQKLAVFYIEKDGAGFRERWSSAFTPFLSTGGNAP